MRADSSPRRPATASLKRPGGAFDAACTGQPREFFKFGLVHAPYMTRRASIRNQSEAGMMSGLVSTRRCRDRGETHPGSGDVSRDALNLGLIRASQISITIRSGSRMITETPPSSPNLDRPLRDGNFVDLQGRDGRRDRGDVERDMGVARIFRGHPSACFSRGHRHWH